MRHLLCFIIAVGPGFSEAQASAAEASVRPKPFNSALEEIVKRSTLVEIQRTRVEAADSLVLASRLSFLPRLSVEASQGQIGDPAAETKQVSATASLNLFKFGSDWAGARAAAADLAIQRARLESAALEAEQAGSAALISLIELKLKAEILRRRITATQEFLDVAQTRYRKGLTPLEEVSRIEIDLSNERAQYDDTVSQLRTAEAGVVRYLGHADVETAWPWKTAMRSAKTRELISRKPALEGRPDVEAARLSIEAESARASQLHRSLFPSLNLSYSRGQIETGGQLSHEWRSMLTLSVPLFEGWSSVSSYRVQSERAREAELTLEQLRRDGLGFQRAYQENFKLGYQTAENRERVLATSQRLLKQNLARFRAGRAGANEFLIERGREAQAELVAVEGWARAHTALIQLYHSFGQSVRGL